MTMRYIFGRAGKGKSYAVYSEIGAYLSSEKPLILIVPEQFTLQAERDLLKQLKLPGMMQIEVLSFNRLAYRVFKEIGGLTKVPISMQGRQMMLKKAVNETVDQLNIFHKASRQEGFISIVNEILAELKRYDIYPEDINTYLNEIEDAEILKEKMADIKLIYDRFASLLSGNYMDSEDQLNILIDKIEETDFLRGAHIWIDGFISFTPQRIKVLDKLVQHADNVTVSLSVDFLGDKRAGDLFDIPKKTYNKLHDIALKREAEEEIINLNNSGIRGLKKPEIAHLEKEIAAYPFNSYKGKAENIKLFAASNTNSEVENAAAEIISLARDRGFRWRDIAVVSNDMDNCGPLIKTTFKEYGISFFMDEKRDIMDNPIINFIMASLEIICRGYQYDDVFRLLKTGFTNLSIDEYESIENYALKYGMYGQKWKKEFYLGENESLARLNIYRRKLIEPLDAFENELKQFETVEDKARALYEYLSNVGIYEKLEKWISELRDNNLYEYVNENTQIWNIVVETLDQLVEILGPEKLNNKEFKELLEEGFSSFEIGIIPTSVDQVLVGDMLRSKLHNIKALFVIGANDGLMPRNIEQGDILSEAEKIKLKEKGLDLELDREYQTNEEKLQIYNNLVKPNNFLYISYALANAEGQAMRPSIYVDHLKKLLPNLTEHSDILLDLDTELKKVSTPTSTFKFLIERLRNYADGKNIKEIWWDVYDWYCFDENWNDLRALVIKGLFHQNQERYISEETAQNLYKPISRVNISRIEKFAECPFAHFVNFGLEPKEREVFEIRPPEVGEMFHRCMHDFSKAIADKGISWHEITDAEINALVSSIMEELSCKHRDGVLKSTYRYRYMTGRLKRIANRTVQVVRDHIKKGEFKPYDYEVGFGTDGKFPPIEIKLENGQKLYVEGRIDRLDIYDGEDTSYLKVIDYKTGSTKFNLADIYYGLVLQLIIYLEAAVNGEQILRKRNVKPGGVFYFKIDDPVVETGQSAEEIIEKELRKKFKMQGLALKDIQIVRKMDKDIKGSSEVLPVTITKDEDFYKNSYVFDEQDIKLLRDHACRFVRQAGGEIMSGNIHINPVKGERSACERCSFKSICQFDTLFENNEYKGIKRISPEEVLKLIKEEEEE